MRVAKACVLAWTRLYTAGMPDELRARRLAEMESDLWEFEHDAHGAQRGRALHLLLRLIPGIWQDVRWRLEQHAPHAAQQPLALNRSVRQPSVVISAYTFSLAVHLFAGAAAVGLAAHSTEQMPANVSTRSVLMVESRHAPRSGSATVLRQSMPDSSHAPASVTLFSAPMRNLANRVSSISKRISGSASRAIVAALIAVRVVSAPDSASGNPAVTVPVAVPLEPIGAVLDAYKTHQIVALGEGDGNEQEHAFRLSLIRDPRFAATVNDIVVEFGNSLYQEVMDRFVRGADVSSSELGQVWRNTTQPGVWDAPIYEEFFRAVRAVNASLPTERQVRVLLGDPPIDWSRVRTREDHFRWIAQRENYPTDLIAREVLAKQRRALLIFGDMHFQRRPLISNLETPPADPRVPQPLISLLEGTGLKAFTIWTNTFSDLQTLQPNIATWRSPSLTLLRGTLLGAADFTVYFPFEVPRRVIRSGRAIPIPREEWRLLPMQDQFDAVLYVGPTSAITRSRPSPALCSETSYIQTQLARMALIGLPESERQRVRQRCPATPPPS